MLAAKRSHYRFGAPLDPRWLQGGWSSHLEHREDGLRLRTDFVSRPPPIDARQLAAMWSKAEASGVPVIDVEPLAALKLTNREKDYAVDALEEALDRERRQLMRRNEDRLDRYREAAEAWARQWPALEPRMRELPLAEAHELMTRCAATCLPFAPRVGDPA